MRRNDTTGVVQLGNYIQFEMLKHGLSNIVSIAPQLLLKMQSCLYPIHLLHSALGLVLSKLLCTCIRTQQRKVSMQVLHTHGFFYSVEDDTALLLATLYHLFLFTTLSIHFLLEFVLIQNSMIETQSFIKYSHSITFFLMLSFHNERLHR